MAVLMVIACHFCQFGPHPSAAMIKVTGLGRTGVDLFFVLSGFLITRILLDQKESPHFIRNFYARRILRIFPLYFAFLLFSATLIHFNDEAGPPSWLYWVFAQDIGMTFSGLHVTHLWSLAVEEQFYLAWPFLVLALRPRALLPALWLIVIAAFFLRAWMIFAGTPTYTFTPVRIDTLAAGAIIAVLEHQGQLERYRKWIVRSLIGGAFILPAAFYAVSNSPNPFLLSVRPLLLAWAYASLLVAVMNPGRLAGALSAPWLRSTGKYSYAMYVLHMLFVPIGYRLPLALGLPVAIALTYVTALASWRFLESPALKLKRHFEYHSGAPKAMYTTSATARTAAHPMSM